MRAKIFLLLSGLTLLVSTVAVRADLAFVLTPSVQSGAGSNEVVFTGTLSNTDDTINLYLNDIQFSFLDAATNYLTGKTNTFFANVPGILLPGETYSDVVFSVGVNSNTPAGTFTGTVTLPGGTNIFATTALTNQDFQIVLGPASLSLGASGTSMKFWWAASPAGAVLQQNLDLATANWVTITNAPVITNGLDWVTLPPSNASAFFRLQYP